MPGHHFFRVTHPPEIFLFAGRFHPLLVHLPIGMMVVLALLEIAAWFPRWQKANASAGFILAVAAPLAVITAACGWLLSLGGGYDPNLLFWHQWLGIVTALGCVVSAIFFRLGKHFAYHLSLFTTAAVLGVAGHLGGSLTHGSDYLTEYAPGYVKKILGGANGHAAIANSASNAADTSAFANGILPLLKKNCVTCHGLQKAKANLRLDSFAELQKGSDDGPVVKPGDAANSPLLQRVLLPADSEDHMPPNGKPQLSADEIAVLKWWVDSGASGTKTLAELAPPPEVLKTINAPR